MVKCLCMIYSVVRIMLYRYVNVKIDDFELSCLEVEGLL